MEGIVVGVDGSEGSRVALERALEEAAEHDETLRVVFAYSASDLSADVAGPPPTDVDLRREAERVVDVMLDEAGAPSPDVEVVSEVMVVPGASAAEALVAASKGAFMLVVGSRGLDGFTGLLLGSVSQQCVEHADCPVLVVPEPPDPRV